VQAPHASTLLYSILFLTAILPVSNWSSSWSTTRPVQDGGRKLLENRLVLVLRGGIDGKLSDGVAEGAQDGSEKDGASQDATRDAGAEESEFTASGAEHSSAILERSCAGTGPSDVEILRKLEQTVREKLGSGASQGPSSAPTDCGLAGAEALVGMVSGRQSQHDQGQFDPVAMAQLNRGRLAVLMCQSFPIVPRFCFSLCY
jgi:hypothetical protein